MTTILEGSGINVPPTANTTQVRQLHESAIRNEQIAGHSGVPNRDFSRMKMKQLMKALMQTTKLITKEQSRKTLQIQQQYQMPFQFKVLLLFRVLIILLPP